MPAYKCQSCGFVSVSNILLVCPNPRCKAQNPKWVPYTQGSSTSPAIATPVSFTPQKADFDKPLQLMKLKLPQVIVQDSIAVEIQKIINEKLETGSQTDARLILDMFVFLSHYAADLIKLIGGGIDERKHLAEALARLFSGREIVPGDNPSLFDSDERLQGHFLQAWFEVGIKWPEKSDHRIKFVKDIFVSPKGYAKTARDLERWTAPTDVDLPVLLQTWLGGFVNDSIFTGMSLPGVIRQKKMQEGAGPKTRKEQIAAWYAEDAKSDRNYKLMWGSVFLLINGAYGLNPQETGHKESFAALLRLHQNEIKLGFANTIESTIINRLLWERFSEVYDSVFAV